MQPDLREPEAGGSLRRLQKPCQTAFVIFACVNVPSGTVADCGAVMSENGRSGKTKKAGRCVHSLRRFRKHGHMLAAASSGFVGSAADRKLGRAEVKAEAARAGPNYPVLLREALLGMFFSGEIIDASRITASPSRNDAQASRGDQGSVGAKEGTAEPSKGERRRRMRLDGWTRERG